MSRCSFSRHLKSYSHTEEIITREHDERTGRCVKAERVGWRDLNGHRVALSERPCSPVAVPLRDNTFVPERHHTHHDEE